MTDTEIYNLLVAVANRQTTPEEGYEKYIEAKSKKNWENRIFWGVTIPVIIFLMMFVYSCYHSNP